MVARDFDQYLFFYEFLNAFTESLEKKIDRERVKLDSVHLIIFFPGISFHCSTPKLMCIKQITMGQ